MTTNQLNFQLPAIRVRQREERGQAIYMAVIKAKEFMTRENERFIIDYYRRENGKEDGYQRPLAHNSVSKIKDYILKEVKYPILPTSILANARYKLKFEALNDPCGQLTIDQPLYIIDGQHRFEAWKQLMHDDKLKEVFGDYEFPVVILSGFEKIDEIEQFYVINSRQKRIKTDLAQRNFLSLAGHEKTESLIPERSKWTMYATKIVDILNEETENSIWHDHIILPDDGLDLRKRKIISQASFVSSLKPMFIGRDAIFVVDNKELPKLIKTWASFINNYWQTIYKIYPEAIDNLHDYSLMKTVGVFSLHLLLVKMINQKGLKDTILNPKTQSEILKDIQEKIENAKKNTFKLDFWRVKVSDIKKERGEYAGSYSSSVGHNKIVSKILLGY